MFSSDCTEQKQQGLYLSGFNWKTTGVFLSIFNAKTTSCDFECIRRKNNGFFSSIHGKKSMISSMFHGKQRAMNSSIFIGETSG